jgi:hypothetical protein
LAEVESVATGSSTVHLAIIGAVSTIATAAIGAYTTHQSSKAKAERDAAQSDLEGAEARIKELLEEVKQWRDLYTATRRADGSR